MKNRFGAMRRLIAALTIMAVPVITAGCSTCRAPAAPATPDCAAPVPVCATPVPVCAQPVTCAPLYAAAYVDCYGREAKTAEKPASGPRRKAKESVRVDGAKGAAPAAAAPALKKAPAAAPAQTPQVKVLPPIVAPAITSDGTPLATVSDAYTITPGQTYTVLPAPTSAQVVSPVAGAAAGAQAQQPATGYVRVLGPSTMGLTAAEIENYSKSESYGVPPEPEPVAGQ